MSWMLIASVEPVAAAGVRYDVSGDGKADAICFHRGYSGDHYQGYVWVTPSSGTSFPARQTWVVGGFCTNGEMPVVGDFSGDGMADVASVHRGSAGDPNQGAVLVTVSYGNGFIPASPWNSTNPFCLNAELPVAGDFNGDGVDDLACFHRGQPGDPQLGNVSVALSTSTNFAAPQLWTTGFTVGAELPLAGDFNGDGKSDIVCFHRGYAGEPQQGYVYVALSSGTNFTAPQLWATNFCVNGEIPFVGDVNGDGKYDIICFHRGSYDDAQQGDVWVALSTGTNFATPQLWATGLCVNAESPGVADFTGDGKADAAVFHSGYPGDTNQGNVWVARSTGTNFASPQIWNSRFGTNDEVLQPALTLNASWWPAGYFYNPLIGSGADPQVSYLNGNYYYPLSANGSITVGKANNIADPDWGIGGYQVAPVNVFTPPAPNNQNVWAPELHYVNGNWYLYYSAGQVNDPNFLTCRTFCAQANTQDPQGSYTFKGQVYAPGVSNYYAIDGTVMQLTNGSLYFLCSSRSTTNFGNQNLYIAPMSNPWTVSGSRVQISSPTYSWEGSVNEAPAVLQHNGRIFVIYSGYGTGNDQYCLGQLVNTDGNVLNPASWTKSSSPVFQSYSDSTGGIWGPGSNGFTTSPDGLQDWIIYCAEAYHGSGLIRSIYAQPFTWNANGSPNFGHPNPTAYMLSAPPGPPLPITNYEAAVKATPGLVSFYPLQGNANDAWGTNHGTLIGTTSFTTGVAGGTDKALFLQGSGWVNVGAPVFNFPNGKGTVELWLRPDWTSNPGYSPCPFADRSATTTTYSFYLDGAGKVNIGDYNGSTFLPENFPAPLSTGIWHHLAVVFNAGTWTLYTDGINCGTVTQAMGPPASAFQIGSWNYPNGGSQWIGALEQVAVYTNALTQTQIQAHYNAFVAQPQILAQPVSGTNVVAAGLPLQLSVNMAPNSAPPHYQWYANSASITNATNSILTLAAVGESNAVTFTCVISNSAGSVTSSPVVLQVGALGPAITAYEAAVNAEPGLISFYPFDNFCVTDFVGTNHGTLFGDAGFTTGMGGGPDKALLLDGMGWVNLSAVPAFDFTNGVGTVELWLRADWASNPGYDPCPFADRNGTNTTYSFYVDGAAKGYIGDYNGTNFVSENFPVPLGQGLWHYLAISFSGNSWTLVLDSNLVGTVSQPLGALHSTFQIGSGYPNGNSPWIGAIQDVAIYSTNLAFPQLQAHYNAFVNGNRPTINFSVSGGQLTLSWPSSYQAWILQLQTNALSQGLSANWVDIGPVPTTTTNLSINTENGSVFYRLRHP